MADIRWLKNIAKATYGWVAVSHDDPMPVSLEGSVTITADLGDLDATIVAPGTTAPAKLQYVGGKTNDATAQYKPIPEGAGGRSVIVEGYSGGTAQPTTAIGSTAADAALTAAPVTVGARGSAAWFKHK